MSDADALYKNAGAFTMFEELKLGQSLYFNRTIWPNGDNSWLGPWENQIKAHEIADFVKIKRVKTAFIVRVTKQR
ncbi:hypothetical protein JZX87_23945 [Agrobacterium sp. Ap1]|uniref:hypothetical protein n=1 Tax=Agrobacterium sp. Ap1 TaxID=2815337 RepID=UPI000FACEF73|nr:hypothetical protein [Agrobacterium sp. Ap1]MBO0144212.1 hypothetical protein [Agrobacterium sp. Ap1]